MIRLPDELVALVPGEQEDDLPEWP